MTTLIKHNGSPAISHNGKIYPPMMATIRNVDNGKYIMDAEYHKNLGKSGIKIYFLICDTLWIREDAFEKLDEEARMLFSAVPDALIMLRIGLHPSNEWIEQNMDECIKLSDGSNPKAFLATESYCTEMPGCYTLYSDKWRKDAGKWLEDTLKKLQQKPYYNRIAGVFIAAGDTSEWRQLGPLTIPEQGIYGDCSEAMKQEFSLYLREKYTTEDNLKKAWHDNTATFDCPKIPDMDERYYSMDMRYDLCGVDYDIKHRNRREGHELDEHFYDNQTHIGSFLNVNRYMSVFDFYRARSYATTQSLIYLSNIVKAFSNDLLVGAFYGNYGATHFYNHIATACVHDILKSCVVDIFSAPGVYQNRQRGGFEGQRCMYDSMRLHGAMFVVEDDTRTHIETPELCQALDVYTVEDSIDILKRNFGRNICDDLQGWWFDQHLGGKRYKHEKIYELFNKQSEIAQQAYSLDRTKEHEIAFIYDEESVHMVSPKTTHDTIEYIRNYEIARIGAGVDIYYHNDLSHPDMQDYKLYVFFNTYCLSTEERENIKKKLSKNNATALFMYGSGIINPDNENPFDISNMQELLGMTIKSDKYVRTPMFRVCADNKYTTDMKKGISYGDLDRHIKHSVIHISDWEIGNYERSYLCPCFYPTDGNVVARFCETGNSALTIKEHKDYTIIYCGTKVIRAEVIRSIARASGCHIWTNSDDVLYQNKNYITIHASEEGIKTLFFPNECSPIEVYENKLYGENTKTISFFMKFGETKMFYIGKPLSTECFQED